MGRDVELFRQDGAVARRLVEHDDEVAVLEDVLHLPAGEQVLHILGDAGGDAAPFPEPFPNLHGVGRRLLLLQEQMELVHEIPGGLARAAVLGHAAPHLVLHHQHPDLLHLLAQVLDVEADDAVLNIHVGAVVEDVERPRDIDFKGGRHMAGLLLLLL